MVRFPTFNDTDLSKYHPLEEPVYPEINSRVSSSEVEEIRGKDGEQMLEQFLEQEDHKRSSQKA